MKRIYVKNSRSKAIVDDEDYDTVIRYAWYLRNGYAYTTFHRKGFSRKCPDRNVNISMSRLIADRAGILSTGRNYVDHINGVRLDNRRSNLRAVTLQENNWNLQKHREGIRGIRKTKHGTYQVRLGSKTYGNYPDEVTAHLVYNRVARSLRGEFACLFDVDGKLPSDFNIPNFTEPAGARYKSGVPGVVWFKSRNCWRVIVKGKTLGYFTSLDEAIAFRGTV